MVAAIPIGYIDLMWSKNVVLCPLNSIGFPSWSVTRMLMLDSCTRFSIGLYIKLLGLMERSDPAICRERSCR